MASIAALSGLATAARGVNGVSVAEARRHTQNLESFRRELPHEHDAPAGGAGGLKEEETAGHLRRVVTRFRLCGVAHLPQDARSARAAAARGCTARVGVISFRFSRPRLRSGGHAS